MGGPSVTSQTERLVHPQVTLGSGQVPHQYYKQREQSHDKKQSHKSNVHTARQAVEQKT